MALRATLSCWTAQELQPRKPCSLEAGDMADFTVPRIVDAYNESKVGRFGLESRPLALFRSSSLS
jgi:hypothetical protein